MAYSQPSGPYPVQQQHTTAPVSVQPQAAPPIVMTLPNGSTIFVQQYTPVMNSQVVYTTMQQVQDAQQAQMQFQAQMLQKKGCPARENWAMQQVFYQDPVVGPMGHFNLRQPTTFLPVQFQHPVHVSAAISEAGAGVREGTIEYSHQLSNTQQHMNYEAGAAGMVGNPQQLPAGMQNLQSHGAETALDSNFFGPQVVNLEPGAITSEGMIGTSQPLFGELQNFPSHEVGETDADQAFFECPEQVPPVSEKQIVPSHDTTDTYQKIFVQTDAHNDVVKKETSSQLQRLKSTVRFFEHDREMKRHIETLFRKLNEQARNARWSDEDHFHDFAQDHKKVHQNWEIVNSFLSFVSIASDLLEKEGQNTSPSQDAVIPLEKRRSYMLVLKLIGAVETMTKKSFDEIGSVDFSNLKESQSLLCAMQRFKINNVYAKSLSSLRSHRRNETKKFIESLQQHFVQIRTTATPDQLQSFIEYMHEVSKLFEIEMSGKRRIGWLTQDCVRSFKFLKSSDFDPKDALDFKSFDTMVRALRFSVLSYKMMKAPGCRLGQNVSHDRTERGSHVVRCRLKRKCNCTRQGFELVKFLYQIKTTDAVGVKSILVRDDYKSPKKDKSSKQDKKSSKPIADKQERKLSGLLFYIITPTALQAEQLLQLLIAWGERKEVREMVFAAYPKLLEAQADRLTDEADRARSEDRQAIIRKAKSMPDNKEAQHYMRPDFDAHDVLIEAIERDEATRARLCEDILAENWRWTDHALERQKAMYHFDFAHEKDTREKNPEATVDNYKRYLYNETEI